MCSGRVPLASPLVPSPCRLISSPSPSPHAFLPSPCQSTLSSSSVLVGSASSVYNSRTASMNFINVAVIKKPGLSSPSPFLSSFSKLVCRAVEYKFPDPIPEFAEAETEKFRTHLLTKLPKRGDIYGDSVEELVNICTEIFSTFLHTEYGGPGTLLVIPFIDMADTINERGLPGGPQAARAAVKWAQKHVDKDWNEWTGGDSDQ